MHYLFLDESYPRDALSKVVTVAAWTVEQKAFDAYLPRRRELYRRPVPEAINSMLEALNGWAVIARGTFHNRTYRPGERDGTDEIVEMARPDNIWSQCIIFATAMLFKELIRRNVDVDTVDIYHDPKALKRDHYDVLVQTLRSNTVSLAKQFITEQNISAMQNLNIRRIEAIDKPTNDQSNQYQLGTWVSDKLCELSGRTWEGKWSRIIQRDLTELVRRTTQQFDGRSFQSD